MKRFVTGNLITLMVIGLVVLVGWYFVSNSGQSIFAGAGDGCQDDSTFKTLDSGDSSKFCLGMAKNSAVGWDLFGIGASVNYIKVYVDGSLKYTLSSPGNEGSYVTGFYTASCSSHSVEVVVLDDSGLNSYTTSFAADGCGSSGGGGSTSVNGASSSTTTVTNFETIYQTKLIESGGDGFDIGAWFSALWEWIVQFFSR